MINSVTENVNTRFEVNIILKGDTFKMAGFLIKFS